MKSLLFTVYLYTYFIIMFWISLIIFYLPSPSFFDWYVNGSWWISVCNVIIVFVGLCGRSFIRAYRQHALSAHKHGPKLTITLCTQARIENVNIVVFYSSIRSVTHCWKTSLNKLRSAGNKPRKHTCIHVFSRQKQ